MPKSLHPSSIIESTNEYFVAKISRRSQAIYLSLLVFLISLFCAMPFIYVNVTVSANGILRPLTERAEIKPLITGLIDAVYVKEGDKVEAGAPLLRIKSESLEDEIELLKIQVEEYSRFVGDLEAILKNMPTRISTQTYTQQYSEYSQKKNEITLKKNKAERDLQRAEKLFSGDVISQKELEEFQFQYSIVNEELQLFLQKNASAWQKELVEKEIYLEELVSKKTQLEHQRKNAIILSPISGTVEQFTGIYIGSVVQEGQTLCLVSPDTALVAEILVSPKDIAWLSVGNKANLQIDAFNYRDWGMVNASIRDISSDFQLVNQVPVFKVHCTLESLSLSLDNGITGNLKKGMTLNARFFVAERSIFQLLTDRIDDWLNPSLNRKKQ